MNCSHAFFFAEASLAFVSGFRTHLSKSPILDRVIFVQYKVVVLTLVAQKNGETIFLDQAIPQVHFMKLLSCSLYNSWDTSKKQSIAIMGEETKPMGEQGWCSGESARLPPMCPGFDSRTRRHMWAEFVGSLLCSERFFSGNSGFPLSSKTNI